MSNLSSFSMSLFFAASWTLGCASANRPAVSEDTCEHGDIVSNPQVESQLAKNGGSILVRWDPGPGFASTLPDEYFAQVKLAPSSSSVDASTPVDAVRLTASRQINITIGDLRSVFTPPSDLVISLEFPDHATFSKCIHPGMRDRYYLDLTLSYDANWKLVGTHSRQYVELGNI